MIKALPILAISDEPERITAPLERALQALKDYKPPPPKFERPTSDEHSHANPRQKLYELLARITKDMYRADSDDCMPEDATSTLSLLK